MLHSIIEQCLEPRRKRRPEMSDLVTSFEVVRKTAMLMQAEVPDALKCPIIDELMEDPGTHDSKNHSQPFTRLGFANLLT